MADTPFDASLIEEPLVFIDLETTGANFAVDRIIEIGLIEVDQNGVREWSSLVDPQQPISGFITGLTGIDTAMTATAPRFAELAPALLERLQGRLLVAHNARFDYGFLKREFARLGIAFRSRSLCTVKLSRQLFPQHHRHSLAVLIERHGIHVDARHRALADARVLWDVWQCWSASLSPDAVWAAVPDIVGHVELPPHLDPALADDLPESAGAFAFYDGDGKLLHSARSANVRRQVLGLLAPARWESTLVRATRRIEWRECAGEFGARLNDIAFSRAQRPLPAELYTWRLHERAPGDFRPELVAAVPENFVIGQDDYGLYTSRREALLALRKLAEANHLCFSLLGLGDAAEGKPCVAFRQRACRGACVGKESPALHGARLQAALARIRLQHWPHAGIVRYIERDEFGLREDHHLFDHWRWLGSVANAADIPAHLTAAIADAPAAFDPEIYRVLNRFTQSGKIRPVALDSLADTPALSD